MKIFKANFKKILSTVLAAAMLVTACVILAPASVSAGSAVVYVSPTGSDTASGAKNAPFATIAKAYAALSPAGGTIVITGDMPEVKWNNSATFTDTSGEHMLYEYPHTGLITITGKDPASGTVYSDAKLYYTSIGLHGPTKLEYIQLEPNRSSLFINTVGHPFTVGKNVTANSYGICIHDGVGETSRSKYGGNKSSVDSINFTLDGGTISSYFAGGGYPKKTTEGINGNVNVTVNSGKLSGICIGYNKYFTDDTDAIIGGNVIITVNGGVVSSISNGNILNGKVGGYVALIMNNDTYVSYDLPGNTTGEYIIYSGKHGKVSATDTAGRFNITPDKGFYAVVNGEKFDGGHKYLPRGENHISYCRIGSIPTSDEAYSEGYPDGRFYPEKAVTRAEAAQLLVRLSTDESAANNKALVSSFSDISVSDWYYNAAAYLESVASLPDAWLDAGKYDPNENITRAEFISIAESLLPHEGNRNSKLYDFWDVKPNNPYYDDISAAARDGIVLGYEGGTFKPDARLTRAEAVTIINRYAKRLPVEGAKAQYSDTQGHWAQAQIAASAADLAEGVWTKSESINNNTFKMPEGTAKEYVTALYDQSKDLSGTAIRNGVDVIAAQMKEDILNTPNTEEIYADKITGNKYYVSEKSGKDVLFSFGSYEMKNTTASKSTPLKTIAGIANISSKLKAGDAILFECGGVYRGTVNVNKDGIIYGSYGTGNKPLILQSKKNYADPALWEETEYENVYRCTDQLTNVGVMGFDHDMQDYSDDSYNELYGKIMNIDTQGFTGVQDLCEDLQFYSVIPNKSVTTAGDLYLYSTEGNPGSRFSSIEIGERANTFNGKANDVVIDNLSFKFTGAHAMGGAGGCKNRTVTNCIFSWLGGSVLSFNATYGTATNYGNAVEIYGACDGYFVENNWMYQIYDTAVTHQRSASTGDCIQTNIRYTSNLMELVHWGIEFYNAPPTAAQLGDKEDTYTRITNDVIYRYNVLRNGGYGWGSIVRFRQKSARLYCGASLSENYDELTEYNILDRSAGYLVSVPGNSNEDFDKNIYIQTVGCTLGTLKGVTMTCDYNAHTNIKTYLGDNNAVVVVVDESVNQ